MKNLSKKHLKHLWNRYLFYSNYYNKEILKPEDLPIYPWIYLDWFGIDAMLNDFKKENNLFRRLNREGEKIGCKIYLSPDYTLPAFFKEDSK